ncbi:MAG: hypothetical protein U1E59_17355 [Amaricoccus sp.]
MGVLGGFKAAASRKGRPDGDLKIARELSSAEREIGRDRSPRLPAARAPSGASGGMNLGGQALDFIAAVMTLYAGEVEEKYAKLVSEVEACKRRLNPFLNDQEGRNSLMMWWALATAAYHPGPAVGAAPMAGAEVCSTQASQCATVKSIIVAARDSLHPPASSSGCTQLIALNRC